MRDDKRYDGDQSFLIFGLNEIWHINLQLLRYLNQNSNFYSQSANICIGDCSSLL